LFQGLVTLVFPSQEPKASSCYAENWRLAVVTPEMESLPEVFTYTYIDRRPSAECFQANRNESISDSSVPAICFCVFAKVQSNLCKSEFAFAGMVAPSGAGELTWSTTPSSLDLSKAGLTVSSLQIICQYLIIYFSDASRPSRDELVRQRVFPPSSIL